MWVLFWGVFDKYVEILCFFRELLERFGSIRKLFGLFWTNLEISTEILCYFLCYFLITPEFGRSPEIREPATALLHPHCDVYTVLSTHMCSP